MRANKFFSSFIKVHILHHCEHEEIYGVWMIKELDEHGYNISPGALYPIFKNLEKDGLIKSREEQDGKVKRKYYRITPRGKKELVEIRIKLKELVGELLKCS